ncbi:MAG TPA: type II toxin-antitoxin system VapC family toxin [Terracidiphilus sp.]|nr:type II toxin-antitoxin system VapC family toxin [Terracidiphilus sp.]
MIGIDTNILIRYFVKDDPVQTPLAVRTIYSLSGAEPGWISLLVLAELTWSLRRLFKLDRSAIATVVRKLLDSQDIILEQDQIVRQALGLYASTKADLTDCILSVSARLAGCRTVATLDEVAARDLGMHLIK